MLGVQFLGRALVVGGLADLVIPDVAALLHLAVGVGGLDHDDVLKALEITHRLVDLLLDRRGLALTAGAVDGDQGLGLRELHPLLDRVSGEAPEDDIVRRADPGAGQHRDGDLGDHREVDPDYVALPDTQILERVGEALHIAVQVGVGDLALLAFLSAPVVGDTVAVAGLDVAVDAVVGGVDLAVREPLVERRVGVVEDLLGLLEPMQLLGLLDPPSLPVAVGLVVDRRVVQQRVLLEVLGRFELLDVQHLIELLLERAVARLGRCRVCHCKPLLLTWASRTRSADGRRRGHRRPGRPQMCGCLYS